MVMRDDMGNLSGNRADGRPEFQLSRQKSGNRQIMVEKRRRRQLEHSFLLALFRARASSSKRQMVGLRPAGSRIN
jgi:hypothetical protein